MDSAFINPIRLFKIPVAKTTQKTFAIWIGRTFKQPNKYNNLSDLPVESS
jgi:hypothetical protein